MSLIFGCIMIVVTSMCGRYIPITRRTWDRYAPHLIIVYAIAYAISLSFIIMGLR